jgi:hypothetical protein
MAAFRSLESVRRIVEAHSIEERALLLRLVEPAERELVEETLRRALGEAIGLTPTLAGRRAALAQVPGHLLGGPRGVEAHVRNVFWRRVELEARAKSPAEEYEF